MKISQTIPFARLLDWIEDRLPDEEAAEMAAIVAQADETTQQTVAWLRAFSQLKGELKLAAPPAATRQKLEQLFEPFAAARRGPGLIERLAAVLSFDSLNQPALAGARSTAGAGFSRQMIYTAPVAEIALNVQPTPSTKELTLMGQVFPARAELEGPFNIQVRQLPDGQEEMSALADNLGEFRFERLSPGVYRLLLSGDQFEVEIPVLDLIHS